LKAATAHSEPWAIALPIGSVIIYKVTQGQQLSKGTARTTYRVTPELEGTCNPSEAKRPPPHALNVERRGPGGRLRLQPRFTAKPPGSTRDFPTPSIPGTTRADAGPMEVLTTRHTATGVKSDGPSSDWAKRVDDRLYPLCRSAEQNGRGEGPFTVTTAAASRS
jgi:hypothetical protein